MLGKTHYEVSEGLLEGAKLEQDSTWALVLATRAVAHATLAAAARDYGRHTEPRNLQPPTAKTIEDNLLFEDEPTVLFQGAKVTQMPFTLKDAAQVVQLLEGDEVV